MELKAVRKASVFDRVGGGHIGKNKVCTFWLQGRCNRNPCKFMHRESPPPRTEQRSSVKPGKRTWSNPVHCLPKNSSHLSNEKEVMNRDKIQRTQDADQKIVAAPPQKANQPSSVTPRKRTLRNPFDCPIKNNHHLSNEGSILNHNKVQRNQDVDQKIFAASVANNCGLLEQEKEPEKNIESSHQEQCKDLHPCFSGSGFTLLAKLGGHSKAITGIALPSGFDKLYTGGKDKIVHAWDCNTGQCVGSLPLEGEVGCLTTDGPWVYVGLLNTVKAWNIKNHTAFSLNGDFGEVKCIAVDDDMIFAGVEDGSIWVWKHRPETNIPEQVAIMKGHNSVVHSLVIGCGRRLYSASKDCTIKVWGIEDLLCMQTLHGHRSDVMSLICYDRYLISASLDTTVKVWSETESGTTEVVGEIKSDHGAIALCGIYDKEANPILLCSYTDNSVRLHDLPSFSERGRILSNTEVQAIKIGIDGLFFTGNAAGEVSVWKMLESPRATPQ